MKYSIVAMAAALAVTVMWAGAATAANGTPEVDQAEVCFANTDQQAMNCPEGGLLFARFDNSTDSNNAFRVLNTVAAYCDTNYRIVQNQAGVLCVMTHERLDMLVNPSQNDDQPGSAGPQPESGQ